MIIRQEETKDYKAVYRVVKSAFDSAEHSDGNEQDLVNALRNSGGSTQLALAPLSVIPGRQRQGIGKALIQEGHRRARELGYRYSVVLGSETYYPQMGYLPAEQYGIQAPFDVPRENFMACQLEKGAPQISGVVQYAKEFGIG
ncbi:MAG: N-acetyltransferase [Lawsonibacter sp.]|nr:N-acetyltransferase [Lawsonibacter sp.]